MQYLSIAYWNNYKRSRYEKGTKKKTNKQKITTKKPEIYYIYHNYGLVVTKIHELFLSKANNTMF